MDKTKLPGTRHRAWAWLVLAPVAALLLGAACSDVRDQFLFDKPYVEIVITDGPFVASGLGISVVTGTAQNQGTTTAENLTAVVNVGGSYYSGAVGKSYTATEGVDNDIEPWEAGSFRIEVPGVVGGVSASDITFTYRIPEDEA